MILQKPQNFQPLALVKLKKQMLQELVSPASLTQVPYSDQIVVHIRRPDDTPLNSHRRLIWCPFILDDNEENQDDTSQTLALLHEDRVSELSQKNVCLSRIEMLETLQMEQIFVLVAFFTKTNFMNRENIQYCFVDSVLVNYNNAVF